MKNKAFTLAEVLITLGIIGIVAALTIPTLVNKVQNQEYLSALKKFYTTQSSGWAQILADEGVQNLEDTSVFQNMGGYNACYISMTSCDTFFNNLKKYFKFETVKAPSYKTYYLNRSASSNYTGQNVLVLSDGSVISEGMFLHTKSTLGHSQAVADNGGHMYFYQAWFVIDVNGFKKPNTIGRDIFEFYISGDGKLYPVGSKDFSLLRYGNLSGVWDSADGDCSNPGANNAYGYECAARIMDEGWQMNY